MGVKTYGLFKPPFDSKYRFYLSCDNRCGLFLSSNEGEDDL